MVCYVHMKLQNKTKPIMQGLSEAHYIRPFSVQHPLFRVFTATPFYHLCFKPELATAATSITVDSVLRVSCWTAASGKPHSALQSSGNSGVISSEYR